MTNEPDCVSGLSVDDSSGTHLPSPCPVGDPEADRPISLLVPDLEEKLPGRIRGYYVIGSHAEQSAVGLSDLDMVVVFRDHLDELERSSVRAVIDEVQARSRLRLDIFPEADVALSDLSIPQIKLGSVCVYGEDIRPGLTLPPMETYRRSVTWPPYRFSGQILRAASVLTYPLAYPDPADPLYGYARVRVSAWYPAGTETGLKEWVTAVGRLASAQVALQAGQYVSGKADAVRTYRRHVGDGWTSLIEEVYQRGKVEWRYAVPDTQEDMAALRGMCRETLSFENAYFALYRNFLLERLRSRNRDDRIFARDRLTEVGYDDPEMLKARAAAQI